MPVRFRRFAPLLAPAAVLAALPATAPAAAPACPPVTASPSAGMTAVANASPGRLVVRLAAARPRCGELLRLPRSRVRVHARPGGILLVSTPRRTLRIAAGSRRVVVSADAARDALTVSWGARRRVVRLPLLAEPRVLLRRGDASGVPAPVTVVPAPRAPAATPGGAGPGAAPPPAGGTPGSAPVAAARPTTLFAPGSVWNRRVDTAALDPASDAVSADLRSQALATGTWMNTDRWSVPVYVVGPDVPLVTVRDSDDGELNLPGEWRWGKVPLPAGAAAAGPHPDGDNHLVVWQPGTDTMWEFWRFSRTAAGPQAPHGARISGVSRSAGAIPSPYGATASGIALAAGMVTAQDIARGSIDHALVIGVPEIRSGVVVPPATRTDGWVDRPAAPAMGQHFRLDPSVDVDALGLPPLARMVALAAQRHGMVVRDHAGSVTFYGEDPVAAGRDPFIGALRGGEMGEVMRTFPWQHVQLVAPGA